MGGLTLGAPQGGAKSSLRTLIALVGLVQGWIFMTPQPLTARDAALGLTVVCLSCAAMIWDPERGCLAAPFLYVFAFWLFHAGLLISYAVAGQSVIYNRYYGWVAVVDLSYGVRATAWGVVAFTVGCLFLRSLANRPPKPTPDPRMLGSVGVTAAALGFIYVFITYGMNAGAILAGGYGAYLDAAAQGSLFGYAQALVAIGCVMAVASGGRSRRIGWSLFAIYAVTALVIGARGSALFPLLALLAVEGRRWRLRLVALAGVSVAALVGVSVIRQARHLGIGGLFDGSYDLSLWGGLSELGQSFYPILEVQSWMDGGLQPEHGATVIVSFLRALESLTGSAPPATSDPRLLNVEILQLAGPVGSSPIAEGIRNGGLLGVALLMVLIGALVGYAARRTSDPWQAAVLGIIMAPLLIAVRNVLAPVPVQIALGLALISLAKHLERRRASGKQVDEARMTDLDAACGTR